MILADTSAWVEFLRGTGSPVNISMRDLVVDAASIATTEVVVMELLAGAEDAEHAHRLRRLLGGATFLPLEGLEDFERAADISRSCRRNGERVRQLTDCLIAAVALRTGAAVLHRDRDFTAISRATGLELAG